MSLAGRLSLALICLGALPFLTPGVSTLLAEDEAPEAPAPEPAVEPLDLAALSWMTGSWIRTEGDEIFEETWLPPAGGTMAAVSRMRDEARTAMFELSAIAPGPDGVLVLMVRHFDAALTPWASEAGGPGRWTLSAHGARSATFTDPQRDFPRSIIYRSESEDVLEAELRGVEAGEHTRSVVLSFVRIK